jgi:hypothetical protein
MTFPATLYNRLVTSGFNPRLLIVPGILCAYCIWLFEHIRPVYSGLLDFDFDPAYAYLMNGLSIIYGLAPGHVDHPGTSVQILTAGVIAVRSRFVVGVLASRDEVTASVIADAEGYIAWATYLLLAMNAAAILFMGNSIARAARNVNYGLIAQAGVLLVGSVTPRFAYLCPEALAMFSSIMLAGILADRMFGVPPLPTDRPAAVAAWAGLISALGLSAKVTFIPILPLLLLAGSKWLVALAGGSLLLGLTVFLLPIRNHLPQVFNWLIKVEQPFLFLSIAVLMFALFSAVRWPAAPPSYQAIWVSPLRISLVLLACFVGQLALSAKHYQVHYLAPVLPLAGLVMAWVVWTRRGSKNSIVPLAAVGLGFACYFAVSSTRLITTVTKAATERQQAQAFLATNIGRYKDPIVVMDYRTPAQSFALHFGATYTRGIILEQVRAAMPRELSAYARSPESLTVLISEHLANRRTVLLALHPRFDASRFELADIVTHHKDSKEPWFYIAQILSIKK